MKPQHAHHIFCQFPSEYYGNSRACSMLYIKYQQARLNAAVKEIIASQGITASASNLFPESLFKTERAKQFQHWFDCYWEHEFVNCMKSYNDYSQPLLILDDFMNYLYLSKRIFPQQWEFLTTTCGICSQDGDDLQDYKERQIFMILLNLQRLANF